MTDVTLISLEPVEHTCLFYFSFFIAPRGKPPSLLEEKSLWMKLKNRIFRYIDFGIMLQYERYRLLVI